MALGGTRAVALVGVDGHVVEVEADISPGVVAFVLVGLPDASLVEARDRVRAAVANAGYRLPARRVTVSLSPASLPKAGSGFDLAIAVCVLAAAGALDPASARRSVHVGELGLDGRLRPVRGVLPAVLAARRVGVRDVVVPAANASEARLVPGMRVHAAVTLADVVRRHGGTALEPEGGGAGAALVPVVDGPARPQAVLDLADVVGQPEARWAVEVAAAGGHHLYLLGPPGAGKTMLAARLPGLLPDLGDDEAVEVTAVHSLAGTLDPAAGLLRRPPYEDPHHTATVAAVVGGGSGLPRPGAASRAHRGVLFLDETPEFSPRVLEALRQPLEEGELVVARAHATARFPARFQLVLAANPCPCGLAAGADARCTCTPLARRRYLTRLSGPVLDRVDIRMQVLPVTRGSLALARDEAPESTATVAARVARARAAQRERLRGTPYRCNGELPGALLRGRLRLPARVTRPVDASMDTGGVSARGYDRVLRVAWTLADLDGLDRPGVEEVSRALLLRGDGTRAA